MNQNQVDNAIAKAAASSGLGRCSFALATKKFLDSLKEDTSRLSIYRLLLNLVIGLVDQWLENNCP